MDKDTTNPIKPCWHIEALVRAADAMNVRIVNKNNPTLGDFIGVWLFCKQCYPEGTSAYSFEHGMYYSSSGNYNTFTGRIGRQ